MAYDEDLAHRLRELVQGEEGVTEMRMFGGLAFLVNGNMAVAAGSGGALMVRADPGECDALVGSGEAEFMVMRDRPMKGWLLVGRGRLATGDQLARWVDLGLGYARSLPPKRT